MGVSTRAQVMGISALAVFPRAAHRQLCVDPDASAAGSSADNQQSDNDGEQQNCKPVNAGKYQPEDKRAQYRCEDRKQRSVKHGIGIHP